jgi:hypothetical protein
LMAVGFVLGGYSVRPNAKMIVDANAVSNTVKLRQAI